MPGAAASPAAAAARCGRARLSFGAVTREGLAGNRGAFF